MLCLFHRSTISAGQYRGVHADHFSVSVPRYLNPEEFADYPLKAILNTEYLTDSCRASTAFSELSTILPANEILVL